MKGDGGFVKGGRQTGSQERPTGRRRRHWVSLDRRRGEMVHWLSMRLVATEKSPLVNLRSIAHIVNFYPLVDFVHLCYFPVS